MKKEEKTKHTRQPFLKHRGNLRALLISTTTRLPTGVQQSTGCCDHKLNRAAYIVKETTIAINDRVQSVDQPYAKEKLTALESSMSTYKHFISHIFCSDS